VKTEIGSDVERYNSLHGTQ